MQTFQETMQPWRFKDGYYSYKFGQGYELTFEPLEADGQMYFALYYKGSIVIPKIPVKAGKV